MCQVQGLGLFLFAKVYGLGRTLKRLLVIFAARGQAFKNQTGTFREPQYPGSDYTGISINGACRCRHQYNAGLSMEAPNKGTPDFRKPPYVDAQSQMPAVGFNLEASCKMLLDLPNNFRKSCQFTPLSG